MEPEVCGSCGRKRRDLAEIYLDRCLSCGAPRRSGSLIAYLDVLRAGSAPGEGKGRARGGILLIAAPVYAFLDVLGIGLGGAGLLPSALGMLQLFIVVPWILSGWALAWYFYHRGQSVPPEDRVPGKAVAAFLVVMAGASVIHFLLFAQAVASI